MAARQPILFASLRSYLPAWLRADLLSATAALSARIIAVCAKAGSTTTSP